MKQEKIYVIGHKNPDTDTIVAAMGYAFYKNKLEKTNKYVAMSTGELNDETKHVLQKFKIKKPEIMRNAADKKIILVDHNEMGQVVDGAENAQILEIIDHHKIGDLQTSAPILFHAEPVGSSSTIVADFLMYHKIPIPVDMAGLLLAGILSDTVIFKSPTTTEKDKRIAKKLAEQTSLNINEFGMEVKKAKASINRLTADEVIMKDFKEFSKGNYKFGVGQIEIVDYGEALERRKELMDELERIRISSGYKIAILMVTNILEEATKLWFKGDGELIKKVFKKEPKNNEVFLPGVMSRKKQIVPPIQEAI